jgi:hypothetical protein
VKGAVEKGHDTRFDTVMLPTSMGELENLGRFGVSCNPSPPTAKKVNPDASRLNSKLSGRETSLSGSSIRAPEGWVKARAAGAAREQEHREPRSGDRPRSGGREVPSIAFAQSGAQACTAIGCTEDETLLEVTKGDSRRVLCPRHAQEWVER